MDLSEADIDVLRETYRRVAAEPQLTGGLFYDRLFETAPELRRLFPADMEQQGIKLMSMLGAVVARMHDYAALHPLVGDLARRHVRYGALPEHYGAIGAALLWTLDQRLGREFEGETREAWTRAYQALTRVMLAEAYPPA